jgi:acetylornithine deacetylase/succinyl-diaminopimelate desuccinylase-like protein
LPGLRWAAAILAAGLGSACAAAPIQAPAKAGAIAGEVSAVEAECPRALSLDREALSREAVCLLQRYIQIDTTNPPGNELRAAQFLERILKREGLSAEIIESAPGRANLVARLPGQGRGRALMLVHHMDVVPASASDWSVPPFSGTLRDGYVWGRGSLDNKGPGVAELMSVLMLKRLGVLLDRDVVLLAVADEESGGAQGVRWLMQHRRDLFADVELVLNEGGGILQLGPSRVVYGVEVAQKAPLWLRVTARGASGHGGAPRAGYAASLLVRALARVADYRFATHVLPEVQAMFTERAAAMPEAVGAAYRDLGSSLQDSAFRAQFLSDPQQAALVQNTLAITMLAGSDKENVISERASAVLDVRLLPGQDAESVTRELSDVLAEPALEIETILSWRAHTSPRDSSLFSAIERLARERDPGAPVTTNVISGFTDCNAFRAQSLICYGFLPLRITPDDIARVHGKDERLGVATLSQAILDLRALLEYAGGVRN